MQDIPSRSGSSATTNSNESVKFYHAQRHGPSTTNACRQGDLRYHCKMHMINTNKFSIAKWKKMPKSGTNTIWKVCIKGNIQYYFKISQYPYIDISSHFLANWKFCLTTGVPKLLTQLDLTCVKLTNRGKTAFQIATKWFGLSHPATHHFTAVLINGVRVKRSVRLDDGGISVRLRATTIATPKPTSRSRTVHNKLTVV